MTTEGEIIALCVEEKGGQIQRESWQEVDPELVQFLAKGPDLVLVLVSVGVIQLARYQSRTCTTTKKM